MCFRWCKWVCQGMQMGGPGMGAPSPWKLRLCRGVSYVGVSPGKPWPKASVATICMSLFSSPSWSLLPPVSLSCLVQLLSSRMGMDHVPTGKWKHHQRRKENVCDWIFSSHLLAVAFETWVHTLCSHPSKFLRSGMLRWYRIEANTWGSGKWAAVATIPPCCHGNVAVS